MQNKTPPSAVGEGGGERESETEKEKEKVGSLQRVTRIHYFQKN